MEITSLEAFVEAFVEVPVKVTFVEASGEDMQVSTEVSMKADMEAFIEAMEASMEASIAFIYSVQASMEAVKVSTEAFTSFHAKSSSAGDRGVTNTVLRFYSKKNGKMKAASQELYTLSCCTYLVSVPNFVLTLLRDRRCIGR